MALVNQVPHITSHRLAVNYGFVINYGLPFNLAGFYSPAFWARSLFFNRTSLVDSFITKLAQAKDNFGITQVVFSNETINSEDIDDETTTEVNMNEQVDKKYRRKRDTTAGEFYGGLKETLMQ
jgi:hypothetical protein